MLNGIRFILFFPFCVWVCCYLILYYYFIIYPWRCQVCYYKGHGNQYYDEQITMSYYFLFKKHSKIQFQPIMDLYCFLFKNKWGLYFYSCLLLPSRAKKVFKGKIVSDVGQGLCGLKGQGRGLPLPHNVRSNLFILILKLICVYKGMCRVKADSDYFSKILSMASAISPTFLKPAISLMSN